MKRVLSNEEMKFLFNNGKPLYGDTMTDAPFTETHRETTSSAD